MQAVLSQMQAMQRPRTGFLMDYHRSVCRLFNCQGSSDIDAPAVRAWSGAPAFPRNKDEVNQLSLPQVSA